MQYSYVQPEELSAYADAFERVERGASLRLVIGLLKRIASVLKFPVYVGLPVEIVQNRNKTEQLRALRIVKKLQQARYIENSRYYTGQQADEPPAHVLIHDLVYNHGLGWSGKAAHISDMNVIIWPALGEAIERHSLQHSYCKTNELIQSNSRNLKKNKVDIFRLASLTESERKESTASYRLNFTQDDVFTWVPVTQVGSKKVVYAPWQWFSFSYLNSPARKDINEPLLTPPITTGAAAGQSIKDATLAGLLEVIERDAFIIYWLQQLQAKKIALESIANTEIKTLVQLAKDYRLELHMLYLKTDVPVHTVGLVILDRSGVGPAVNVSAKTGFDITAMIVGILQDQLAQRGFVYGLAEEYPDMVDVPADKLTHASRMLYWQNSKRITDIEHFLAGESCELIDLPVYHVVDTVAGQLTHLYTWFAKKEYPIYYREIISPELKDLTEGVSVVVVKVPDMQPLYLEEQLKATGGARLQSVPKELGLANWYDTHGEYFTVPHPFP